jgi:hypothetical protein
VPSDDADHVPRCISVQRQRFRSSWDTADNGGNYDNQNAWQTDMQAIFNQARMWYFTGDYNYGQKAHDMLLAWATTMTNFGGIESSLDLGDYAYRYGGGADILRATWPGWTTADTLTVSNFFRNVYLPATGVGDQHGNLGAVEQGRVADGRRAGLRGVHGRHEPVQPDSLSLPDLRVLRPAQRNGMRGVCLKRRRKCNVCSMAVR